MVTLSRSLQDNTDTSHVPYAYASMLDYVARQPSPGIPPAILHVKVGGLYRIMRNFSVDRGLDFLPRLHMQLLSAVVEASHWTV